MVSKAWPYQVSEDGFAALTLRAASQAPLSSILRMLSNPGGGSHPPLCATGKKKA